jgi:hypothetical protein
MEVKSVATLSDGVDKKYEKIKKKFPYMSKPPFVMSVLGSCGSGKTSMITSMINKGGPFYNYFDLIIVFVMTQDSNVLFEEAATKKTKVYVLNEFKESDLKDFYEKLEAKQNRLRDEGERLKNVLIIIDDFISDPRLISKTKPNILDKIITTYRHANVSLICVSQSYKFFSPNIRRINLTHLVVCGVNPTELDEVASEHSSEIVDPELFKDIYRGIRRKGWGNFLVVDYKKTHLDRYCHNFRPIKLEIEDDSDVHSDGGR